MGNEDMIANGAGLILWILFRHASTFNVKQKHYPSCVGNSICSFLQANDKGVSVVRYCECGAPSLQCPVKWDQFDGKSSGAAPPLRWPTHPGRGTTMTRRSPPGMTSTA